MKREQTEKHCFSKATLETLLEMRIVEQIDIIETAIAAYKTKNNANP